MFEGSEKPKAVWQCRYEAAVEAFVHTLREYCRYEAQLDVFTYLYGGFVFFVIRKFCVIKVDTPIPKCQCLVGSQAE